MADNANTLQLSLIDDILKGNFNDAEKVLHQNLAIKQNNVLDQEKIKMAGQIFNNIPAEDDEDIDLSDEEIEDALADESEDEEVDDESSEDDDEEEE
jgi:hypothetical protein